MGVNSTVVTGAPEAKAMLCEEPQAILVMRWSLREARCWGFVIADGAVVPLLAVLVVTPAVHLRAGQPTLHYRVYNANNRWAL